MNTVVAPHCWIDSDASLKKASLRWRDASVVGLDIEFVRFNTYYPQAALYQVASESELFLIDAPAIEDFAPLIDLLGAKDIVKVVHGGGEDMEVIRTHLDLIPNNMFDTQLAACVVGHGWSIGYAALVRDCLGIELSKEERRSDWLARPLTRSQVQYCLQDIAYLIELHDLLKRDMERLGRMAWFREEMDQWLRREQVPPEAYYRKMSGVHQMGPRQQAVLQALCEWRELEARRQDQPRQWVVRDEHLLKFARQEKLDRAAIGEALPEQVARRFGGGLLAAFQAGRTSELPNDLARPISHGSRELVKTILTAVSSVAAELDIAPELLGRRREIERCVRAWQSGDRQPEYLAGWRNPYLLSIFDAVLGSAQGSA